MSRDHTYPALERLKQEADGLDVLIEIAPEWLAGFVEYTFELDYLARKRDVLDQRDTIRTRFSKGKHHIESTYGTVVNRALKRRTDGTQPSVEMARLLSDLDDAKRAIDELRADLDAEYLTPDEKRRLQELEADILDAREYARTKRLFDRYKAEVIDEIQAFDNRFEPYQDREQYMVSSDETYLIEQSQHVWQQLSDMSRELKLHVLPEEDAAWLGRQKSTYNEYVDAIPEYNESFVEQERKTYSAVLTSAHGPLNDSQQKAVIRNDRRNLVDASAGTGKTLTLTHRFLYLLEKGVPPERIVGITYMTDAAEEMKSRIAAEAGISERDLNISTIHSFARKICMEAAETGRSDRDLGEARTALADRYFQAAMKDETPTPNEYPELYDRFSDAFSEFRTRDTESGYINRVKSYRETWDTFVREKLGEFVEQARTFELSPSEIRSRIDETHAVASAFGRAGACLVEAYEQIVASESTPTDFDDMIRTAKRIVEANPEEFGRRYDHVLVDEYQDVSESTLGFIDAVVEASEETHLFCVGDDWQSIMGFAGSNVRYFTEFGERYEDVTYTSLKRNYRCPPRIVDAGSDLIAASQAQQNDKQVEAAASADEFDGETMQLHCLDGIYEGRAATYAAERVEQALAEGYAYDDIMVLSRNCKNGSYMYDLRQQLESREIPHTRPDNISDYLPAEFVDSLDREVTYTEKGEAQFEASGDPDSDEEKPPLVTLQSVHASKGTEAPVVIFLHAVGNDPEGIPTTERTDRLAEPATAITSEHMPEERRLFYVALTRAEARFEAIAKQGSVSQFVDDIEEYFSRVQSSPEICGECVEFQPAHEGRPYKATLDCGSFEADLVAWPDNDPAELTEGTTYRITDPVVNSSEYGEEIRYDKSTVEWVSQ